MVVYAGEMFWDRPGDSEAYEVHLWQPPFAFWELRVAGAPEIFFESPGGAAQILYWTVTVAPAGHVYLASFGTGGIDSGIVVHGPGICVGTVEIVDPFTDIAHHIIQAVGIGRFAADLMRIVI